MILARNEIAEIESSNSTESSGKMILSDLVSRVDVKKVRVAWKQDAHFMEPVSFSASTGECVVLRGRSGIGKSTFALGVLGLLDYEGSIRLNNVELRDLIDPHTYIAGAIQSGHIFNTSLRENMKIASPGASDQEIMSALELVELDTLVHEMPAGLDTLLGALGRPLSGGEVKRLNVARALLSSAQILVLDEPTEHLDEALAQRIEERILSLSRILIVITHSGWSRGSQIIHLER
jgi:ABC-type transport system involved in cytochrome bd biosynthesis fused ATPase/permease subunit